MRAVLTAFDTLSADDQDLLSLCVWSGVSYQAAAETLAIPVGTVRSRISRARQRLREAADHPAAPPVPPKHRSVTAVQETS